MSDKTLGATTDLKGVWVNIAGSPSTSVLRDATGTYNDTFDTIDTKGGHVLNGGPRLDVKYVIGADGFATKYDWRCRDVDFPEPGEYQFALWLSRT